MISRAPRGRTAPGVVVRRFGWIGGALLAAACAGDPVAPPAPSPDPAAPARPAIPFHDAYLAAPPAVATAPAPIGLAVASIDPQRGVPRFAWSRPEPAPPEARLPTARATTPAAAAALWHVERHAASLGVGADALASVEVAHVHDLGRGAIVVKLRQRVGGLEVWRSGLRVVLDRDLGLVALSGTLHPAAVPTRAAAAFPLDDAGAVDRAIADVVGLQGSWRRAGRPLPAGARAGFELFADAALVEPARARRVLYPLPDRLVPGYLTEALIDDPSGEPVAARHVIAADDGRVLYRASFAHDAEFTYRVWADADAPYRPADGPQADPTPHPTGVPDGYDPAFVAPADITIDGFNHPPHGAPGDPWLADGATETRGNNVDAYADLSSPDGFSSGDLRASTTAPGELLHTYDTGADPGASSTQRMAAVVQLFYVNNWLHDWWYDSGFDEAAGNAQADNLGRGGEDGDVLLAEAQDSSGTNNANMYTPSDGFSPRMQMYVFDAPPDTGVRRDGTIDNMIIAHEWGHYWHHRLVDCGGQMCGGMSEGFGDFQALIMSVREGDDLDGVWAMSSYVTRAFSPDQAYFGIRRYPYSTDVTRNGLTFRHVRNGEPLPAGVPIADGFGGAPNFQVHNAGEVWASMLWEGLVALLRESEGGSPRYSFEEARRRFADYLVAGMKATPVEPTFLEQRDAILAAAAASDPADFQVLARAFARRGFGSGAVSPSSSSTTGSGVIESFDVTGALALAGAELVEDGTSCDGDGIVDVGETGIVTVRLVNTGAEALTGPTVTVTSTTPGVVFPSGNTGAFAAPIAPFGDATAQVQLRLEETTDLPSSIALTIRLDDASAARPTVTGAATARVQLDVIPGAATVDDVEAPTSVWTADGTWARAAVGNNHVWRAEAAASAGVASLVSPPITVAATGPLVVTFDHRYQFEQSDGQRWDGAVLEVSTDDGGTWEDVATYGDPGYDGVITAEGGNPLAGRAAWTGTSAGWPDLRARTIDLGGALAGETIRLRFRVATDGAVGSAGLELDDLGLTGIDGAPFPATTAETGDCLVGARPVADAGDDVRVTSGDVVALDGAGSTDPDGGDLTYAWSQVQGIFIALADPDTDAPSFVAPAVTVPRAVRFQLIVRDPDDRVSLPDDVLVIIDPPMAPPDAGVPDAEPPPDAEVPPPDAAPEVDAPGPDAGDAPDARPPAIDGDAGGCGCQGTPGGGTAPLGGLALAAGVALALRRRRS